MIPVFVSRWLEQGPGGRAPASLARAISALLAAGARGATCRPLLLPERARVIGVGGATWGGSGKTPLALALAEAIAVEAEPKAPVALIGHAYGARPGRAHWVEADEPLDRVGDEALLAARALASSPRIRPERQRGSPVAVVRVAVGPTRQDAVDFTAAHAAWIVIDGMLQARPRRLYRSLLAVDAHEPWGAGAPPPFGDLRASPAKLAAACDRIVALYDEAVAGNTPAASWLEPLERYGRPCALVPSAPVPPPDQDFSALARMRLGALLGIARPRRVLRALAARGVVVRACLRFGDHAVPSAAWLARAGRLAREERLDAWLATAKCALRLPASVGGRPVLSIGYKISIPSAVRDELIGRMHHEHARQTPIPTSQNP